MAVAGEGVGGDDLDRIARADPVVAAALDLLRIPSPSGQEDGVAALILKKLRAAGAEAREDAHGNVMGRIPASPGHEGAPAVLLAAHMDVVPGDRKDPLRPLRPRLVAEGGVEWVATDGTTTLGGDDKAGAAVILDVAARLLGRGPGGEPPPPHGPVEVVFTREEETTQKGARNLETKGFQARFALVLDGERLFQVVWELASATEVVLHARGGRGGHSGVEIDRPDNVNAIKVLTEIDQRIPQGVVAQGERGVVTSINAGFVEGGRAANVIAPEARITYLLRSAEPGPEEALLGRIRGAVAEVEAKYRALQPGFRVKMTVRRHLPPWAASTDSPLAGWVAEAAARLGAGEVRPASIHAGAEANLYANMTNARGERLQPLLLGVANLEGIHTTAERMDWRSLLRGRDWVLEILRTVAEKTRL